MFAPMQLCFEDRTGRTFAMYRIIVSFLLYTSAVSPAPQDSNVTFLKIQPYTQTNATQTNRTSRVENIPITITTFNNLINLTKQENSTILNNKEELKLEKQNDSFENNDFLRHVRSDDVTTEIDQSETTTETEITTDDVTTTVLPKTTSRRPVPKFSSKLTHLKKSKKNSLSNNSINTIIAKIEKPYRRKFKSRCRCEKIENCPKLQITVPRCPNEYFLCCF